MLIVKLIILMLRPFDAHYVSYHTDDLSLQ